MFSHHVFCRTTLVRTHNFHRSQFFRTQINTRLFLSFNLLTLAMNPNVREVNDCLDDILAFVNNPRSIYETMDIPKENPFDRDSPQSPEPSKEMEEEKEGEEEITYKKRIEKITHDRWPKKNLVKFKVHWKGYDIVEYQSLEELQSVKGHAKLEKYIKSMSKRDLTTLLARKPWVADKYLRERKTKKSQKAKKP